MSQTSNELNSWMTSNIALMENWKWIGLIVALFAGFLIKSFVRSFLKRFKGLNFLKTPTIGFLSKFISTEIENPLSWIGASFFWLLSIDGLNIHGTVDKYLTLAVKLVLALHLISLAYKAVEAIGEMLIDYTKKTTNPLDDQLAPMATKILKVFVIIFGVLIALQNFGFNVMSVLAGLGLGGLALALAAQDTAANLFGSITIVADRPFQLGDWIKVGDTEGTVEDIGFRSTRIRTFYNSLVTIPNSVMAKEKIDNLGLRSAIRIRHVLGFTYETKVSQIRHFMSLIEEYLDKHPNIQKDNYAVNFIAMGDFNLQVLVNFFAEVKAGDEERALQEEFLFFVMDLAEQLKLEFAFPTATHYVKPLAQNPH